MEIVQNALRVDRAMFRDALRLAKKVRGVGSQPALLTYENDRLRIELGGCEFFCNAEGTWEGQVKIPSAFLRELYSSVPKGDEPVQVSTDGRNLRIGQLSVKCEWTALAYPRITMPLGASLQDYLMLPFKYSQTDIDRSDLATLLADAQAKKARFIERATSVLKPLGIKEFHLNCLVDDVLRERAKHEKPQRNG